MAKTKLHMLADEKVDVYEENAKFGQLLDDYHKNHKKSIRDDLWIIAYRAACNWLKKRFGHWWSFEQINELALDILNVLFTRIDNRTKYPNGYRPLNLPTIVEQIFLTVYYDKNKRFSRDNNISWDGLVETYGDSVYDIMSDDSCRRMTDFGYDEYLESITDGEEEISKDY